AADQGPDPAAGLLRRLVGDDDLRGPGPAAARVLRAGARHPTGRAAAPGCRARGLPRGCAAAAGADAAGGHRRLPPGRCPPGARAGVRAVATGRLRPRHLARGTDLRELRMSTTGMPAPEARPVMVMAGG